MGLRWTLRRILRKCRLSALSLTYARKKLCRWCGSVVTCFCSAACSPCLMLTFVITISLAVLLGHILLIYWNVKNGMPAGKAAPLATVDGLLDMGAEEDEEVDTEAEQKRSLQELDSQLYSLIVQHSPNLEHNRRIVIARRIYSRSIRWFDQSRELSRRVFSGSGNHVDLSNAISNATISATDADVAQTRNRNLAVSLKTLRERYRYCPFVPPAFNYDVPAITHVHDYLRVRSFANVTAALQLVNNMAQYAELVRRLPHDVGALLHIGVHVKLRQHHDATSGVNATQAAKYGTTAAELMARINHFGMPFWSPWLQGETHAAPASGGPTMLCAKRHRVAIIIPYRDRAEHLFVLLAHLHVLLSKQLLDFTVFVVEQAGDGQFNKARVMNAGFLEIVRRARFDCYVFHDVDLVPEDDRLLYSCAIHPKHLTVAIDEMDYRLAYPELVGGALVFTEDHFLAVNGYSNMFWGWGAEDDDEAYRILHVGLRILRPSTRVARYTMLKHEKRKPSDWRRRTKLLHLSTRRYMLDGLNNLKYVVKNYDHHPLYTHIIVDIDPDHPSTS